MRLEARRILFLGFKPFSFLSEWGWKEGNSASQSLQQLMLKYSYRHFVSDFDASHPGSQLEFLRWRNGGGLVHRSASVDQTAVIEVGAVVHKNCELYSDVHLGSGCIVGPSVTIGQSTKIGYNVVLNNCLVGCSCVIHPGVCIGQDGFGFFTDEQGKIVKKLQAELCGFVASSYKYAHKIMGRFMLRAKVGNNVEICANTCVDRGSWRDTTIGDHTKIDNLVQIGHNVLIGRGCMLCGQVGIAGSVTIGDYVILGGRVGVRDHVSITSKVRVAGNSCVTKDITEPGDYGGFPAVPAREWRRQVATLHIISKRTTTQS